MAMTSDPYMPDPADAEPVDVIELDADLMDERGEDVLDPIAGTAGAEPDDVVVLDESVGLDDPPVGQPGLDVLVDALVEAVNARDLDAVAELVIGDVEAPFLGAVSAAEAVEALGDLLLRYPTLILTRGELGQMPVAAAWLFDQEHGRYEMVGHLVLEVADSDPERLQRVDHVDEPGTFDDLLVERPEADELPEWNDWTRQYEG